MAAYCIARQAMRFADGEVVWSSAADFEVPLAIAATFYRNFKIVSGTGIKRFLFPLAFRSS